MAAGLLLQLSGTKQHSHCEQGSRRKFFRTLALGVTGTEATKVSLLAVNGTLKQNHPFKVLPGGVSRAPEGVCPED